MSGDPERAEEALGRAGLLALQKFPSHAERVTDPSAWLSRLTYNVCMDLHRERRRELEARYQVRVGAAPETERFVLPRTPASPERRVLHKELGLVLERGVRELPHRLREAVELRLVQGRSYSLVARRLAITEANARKRVQEGRDRLRSRLESYRRDELAAGDRPERESVGERPFVPPVAVTVETEPGRGELVALGYRLPPTAGHLRSLRSYVERHPRGWKKHLELGRLLVAEGSLHDAVALLSTVVERRPREVAPRAERDAVLAARERKECRDAPRRLVLRGTRYLSVAWWSAEEEPAVEAALEPPEAALYDGLALRALRCPGEAARCLRSAVDRGLGPELATWTEEILGRLAKPADR